jgi:uncharacterized damage-inducible protein DinB
MKSIYPQNNLLAAWQTSNRVTEFFFENLPNELWSQKIPGATNRTIRMIAGHIHNARCMWVKMIGRQYEINPPKSVDRRHVSRTILLQALKRSNKSIGELIKAAINNDGVVKMKIPWSNIPSDITHFITYLIAHEAHHRGQIVLVARALGHRLPQHVTDGLWQWKKRHEEVGTKSRKYR